MFRRYSGCTAQWLLMNVYLQSPSNLTFITNRISLSAIISKIVHG